MSVVPVLCECKLLHRWIALAFPLRVPGGAVSFAAMLKRKTELLMSTSLTGARGRDLFAISRTGDFVSCAGSGMQPQPGARQLQLLPA